MQRARRAFWMILVIGLAGCAPSAPAPTPVPLAPTPTLQASATAAPTVAHAGTAAQAPGAALTPMQPRGKMVLDLSPDNIIALPIMVALDKGYFDQAGIDVELQTFRGGGGRELPRLGRGDVDVLPGISPQPGFLNLFDQGFDVKILGSMGTERSGRLTPAWITVVKDEADQIKTLSDLKGRTIEAGAEGTPLDLLAREAVQQAGLTPGTDVTLTYRVRQTPDFLSLAQSHGADVFVMPEPLASEAESEGLVVRWKGIPDVAPWFQSSLLGVSATFAASPTATSFMEAYLLAARDVDATNGQWTPELLATATKYLQVTPDIITRQGNVPYYDPNASLSMESLDRSQQLWVQLGEVKQAVDLQRMVDTQPLDAALAVVGSTTASE